jgi:serine/threonine protein kinase
MNLIRLQRELVRTDTSSDIVHGDIKPQNVLIFNDSSRKYVAKMADFGYSTMVVNDSQTVLLPKSVPWHAPEHHHRNFKFRDAKKTDSYSLGMLCLWLLFQDRFQESLVTARGAFQAEATSLPESLRIYSWLEQAKQEGKLRNISYDQIQMTTELDDEQKEALKTFFDSTLTHDPSDRSSDLKSLMPLLGQDE